jgi:Tol biopolymer transport system component
VFERDYPDGSAAIFAIGTDGRDEHEIPIDCTDPCADPLAPGWTPDGQHIIFTLVVGPFDGVNNSARSAVLWTTDLAGQHLTRVSEPGIDGALEDYNASFAPDGYIVFTRMRNADITPAAFRMNVDGTHVSQLTPWEIRADGAQVSPASSGPTRNTVVFETGPEGGPLAVARTSADRRSADDAFPPISYLTPTTLPNQWNFSPTWSPDGRQIAFARFDSEPTPDIDVWTMRWNGKMPEQVSRSEHPDFLPTWGVGRS